MWPLRKPARGSGASPRKRSEGRASTTCAFFPSSALRTSSTPISPGFALWKKVDGALTVVEAGAHPELDTCKNVQRLALEAWPNP